MASAPTLEDCEGQLKRLNAAEQVGRGGQLGGVHAQPGGFRFVLAWISLNGEGKLRARRWQLLESMACAQGGPRTPPTALPPVAGHCGHCPGAQPGRAEPGQPAAKALAQVGGCQLEGPLLQQHPQAGGC